MCSGTFCTLIAGACTCAKLLVLAVQHPIICYQCCERVPGKPLMFSSYERVPHQVLPPHCVYFAGVWVHCPRITHPEATNLPPSADTAQFRRWHKHQCWPSGPEKNTRIDIFMAHWKSLAVLYARCRAISHRSRRSCPLRQPRKSLYRNMNKLLVHYNGHCHECDGNNIYIIYYKVFTTLIQSKVSIYSYSRRRRRISFPVDVAKHFF